MRANTKRDTKPELRLRSALQAQGLRFRKDYLIEMDGFRVRADVVFTRQRIAVFVDGCYWHSCPDHGTSPRSNTEYWEPKLRRNGERDVLVTRVLTEAGWLVVRLWEHVAMDEAVSRVCQARASRSSSASSGTRPGPDAPGQAQGVGDGIIAPAVVHDQVDLGGGGGQVADSAGRIG